MIYKTAYQQWMEYDRDGGLLSFFAWQEMGNVSDALLPPPGSMFKDSFWAEIKDRWPGEFERFTKWVDEYKNKVEWDIIFTTKSKSDTTCSGYSFEPRKFHDLPPAMQIGIFLQYCIEENHRYEFLEGQPKSMAKLVDLVREWFCEEHEEAVRDHQAGKQMDDFDHNAE